MIHDILNFLRAIPNDLSSAEVKKLIHDYLAELDLNR